MSAGSGLRAVVVGGGPAGLMAAEVLAQGGVRVDLYDAMPSVGRKFLLAGKGGLNLTHSEPFAQFCSRFGERSAEVGDWLQQFDADALRAWAAELGVATMVGTSGRVFPVDLKAAPLLRGWLKRLRGQGVNFHTRQRWIGVAPSGALRFCGADGSQSELDTEACVLACGGGSWAKLGSDGAWVGALRAAGVSVADLEPANCGFECAWSAHFVERFAGQPLKPVSLGWTDLHGQRRQQQGELMITAAGLEGGLIYAHSAGLRELIRTTGEARIELDLAPGRSVQALAAALATAPGRHSWSKHLQRRSGLNGARAGLLNECLGREHRADPEQVAALIKACPLRLTGTRPLDEAISSAGGVRLSELDSRLMLRARPGLFCAGEMLDWEAPTGGYLLTASMASGRVAGLGALDWLRSRH